MLFVCLIIFSAFAPALIAQDYLTEDVEISVQAGDFLNRLQRLAENPFDLNRVSIRRMLEVPFINRSLAGRIVAKRKSVPFKSIAELKKLEGMTDDLFQAIYPFFKIQSHPSRFTMRLEQRTATAAHKVRGYSNHEYGNRIAIRQRLILKWNDQLQLLLQSEKDAGERNWMDHFSGSLQLQNFRNSILLLGDYYTVFGHGLLAAGAYGSRLAAGGGISPLAPSVIRLRGKTGADEASFLRGIACIFSPWSRLQLVMAASRRQLDGVLNDDSTAIKRLDVTGLHRTDAELARRNTQAESLFQAGGSVAYKHVEAGFLWLRNDFKKPLELPTGNYTGGDGFSALFKMHGERAISSVELAATSTGNACLGALALNSGRLQYGASVFQYTRGYIALHGKQLGSFSDSPANRKGTEILANLKLNKKVKLSVKAGISTPVEIEKDLPLVSRQLDLLLQKDGINTDFSMRYSSRFSGGEVIRREGFYTRHRWRAEWRFQPKKEMILRQRLEYSRHQGKTFGISLMHDFRYSFNGKSRIQFRYTHFDIPDFQLRQYEVESGLPGELESRLLNGRGYKWFLLMVLSPIELLSFAVKYRTEYFPDREMLGSGNDLVTGNARRDLRIYMRIEI